MRNDWKPIKFELVPYKDSTEYYVIKGVDVILEKLDEDIGKVM